MRSKVQLIISVVVLAAMGLLLVAAFSASGSVADPASAVRGSLGTSLEDLGVDNGAGALTLILNGAFALLAGVWVLVLTRSPHTKVRTGRRPTVGRLDSRLQ
jgi:hypothetical protein